MKAYFQKIKMLGGIGIILFFPLSFHAAERTPFITFEIENKALRFKTQLTGDVSYRDGTEEEISHDIPEAGQYIEPIIIPKKPIKEIHLLLCNYSDGINPLAGTLMVELSFKPAISVIKKINLVFVEEDRFEYRIVVTPDYYLPPKFNEE